LKSYKKEHHGDIPTKQPLNTTSQKPAPSELGKGEIRETNQRVALLANKKLSNN
jgi:hypothetical protein